MVLMSHRYGHVDALTQREAMSRLDRAPVPTTVTTQPRRIELSERRVFLAKSDGLAVFHVHGRGVWSPQMPPQAESRLAS
jgi:hypothetical protein